MDDRCEKPDACRDGDAAQGIVTDAAFDLLPRALDNLLNHSRAC
jgi:hypothetical protein